MSVQQGVRELESLGPLPSEEDASDEILDRWEAALRAIHTPITDEEAVILCGLFGPDDGYGLSWKLLHTVETAPGWFLEDAVSRAPTEWAEQFRKRHENYEHYKKHPDDA
jgi:hypothetical protein